MPLGLGSAFENGTDQYEALRRHLWVIISNPEPDGNVVMVNLSSWHNQKTDDPACIINHGEHEFVDHKTYVSYIDTRSVAIDQLESLKQQRRLIMYSDVSSALLKKIWDGATKSKHMKGKYLTILKSQRYI